MMLQMLLNAGTAQNSALFGPASNNSQPYGSTHTVKRLGISPVRLDRTAQATVSITKLAAAAVRVMEDQGCARRRPGEYFAMYFFTENFRAVFSELM